MIRSVAGFLLLFIILGLSESCSVQKRRHLPGWHVNAFWMRTKVQTPKVHDTLVHVDKQSKTNASSQGKSASIPRKSNQDFPVFVENKLDSICIQQNEVLEKIKVATDDQNRIWGQKNQRQDLEAFQSVKSDTKRKWSDSNTDDAEGEKHFWGRCLGGILGVLLALIALIPIFLFILLMGDIEMDEVFIHSSTDSPFVRSFKTAFNAVIKYGVFVLWIIAVLIFLVAVFALGLELAGVMGGILAVLLVVGVFVLLGYLLGNAIKSIFPD